MSKVQITICGNPSVAAPRTILVHFKDAAGNAYNDGYIVKQRGRKQFDVQSAADTDPTHPTRTRCTLIESGTIVAKQMYIVFDYDGDVGFGRNGQNCK